MLQSWSELVDNCICTGEFVRLDRWISFLEDELTKNTSLPSGDIENRVTLSMFNALALRQPDSPQIGAWEERALMIMYAHKDIDIEYRLKAGINLCVYHLWTGRFGKATLVLGFLNEAAKSGALTDVASIIVKTADAFSDLFMKSASSCVRKVSDALQLAEKTGVHLCDDYLLLHGLTASLSEVDMETFEAFRGRLTGNHDKGRNFDQAYYHFILAWKARMEGDMENAFHNQELSLKLAKDTGLRITGPLYHIKMAEIQYERGHMHEASTHLSTAYESGLKMKSPFFEYLCLLLETQMDFDSADKDRTYIALDKLLSICRRHNFTSVSLTNRSFMTRICMKALQAGTGTDLALEVIRKHKLMPDTPPLDIENWPYPVGIYTLGKFDLARDGDCVKLSGKARSKPVCC